MSPATRSMTKGLSSQPMGYTPHSTSNSSSNTASVMVTNASTLEEEVAGLIKVIEGLTQKLERQDLQIFNLVDKVGTGDASQIKGKQVMEDNGEETSTKRQIKETGHTARELQISADGGIQVDYLKDLLLETVKGKFEEGSKSSFIYTKPYTKRIDNLRQPTGYPPPKFQ
ncbi:hypothetical protein ACS0TY_032683 [Phlomoides rotata]